jgi:hypothetical protein
MKTKKNVEPAIHLNHNYLGGCWFNIKTDSELETEISLFRGIGEFKVSEILTEFNLVLFDSEQFKY